MNVGTGAKSDARKLIVLTYVSPPPHAPFPDEYNSEWINKKRRNNANKSTKSFWSHLIYYSRATVDNMNVYSHVVHVGHLIGAAECL